MTISYSPTRFEVVRTFLFMLPRSPRTLLVVVIICAFPGVLWVQAACSSHRDLTLNDAIIAFVWTIVAFCFFLFWIFLRAKPKQRILTVSEQGIHTEIGSTKVNYPWGKLKDVKDVGPYLLMVTWIGNAYLIPSRAFSDSAQRQQFIAEVARYRTGS